MQPAASGFGAAALALALSLAAGCGGTVVFEENGAGDDGGDGGSNYGSTSAASRAASTSSSGMTGGDGGADVTSTAIASTAVSVVSSTASGPADPCLGLSCGDTCFVCNEVECLQGSCDEAEACVQERVCPLIVCYELGSDPACAEGPAAFDVVCRDCVEGEGACGFFGNILGGPFFDGVSCCYEVDQECLPAPG